METIFRKYNSAFGRSKVPPGRCGVPQLSDKCSVSGSKMTIASDSSTILFQN